MQTRRCLTFALLLAAVAATAGVTRAADGDGDGVDDSNDNCEDEYNPTQTNGDFDRFGNACDGDVDNDGDADATDLGLISGETTALDPRLVADVDDDGDVDDDDLDYFSTKLASNPPGPAGANAHDTDLDGVLDFCAVGAIEACIAACVGDYDTCYASCNPNGLPFPHRRDPAVQPDLLANGSLDSTGSGPDSWAPLHPVYHEYRSDVARIGDGAIVFQTWGGAGYGGDDACGGSCIRPEPITVDHGTTYAFSFYSCAPEHAANGLDFRPTVLDLIFDEYDGAGVWLGSATAESGSKQMNSEPGLWEENVYFYTPSSAAVASARPKLYRKVGPGNQRRVAFVDDFAMWALDVRGRNTYRAPPRPKVAFQGARTRVDPAGAVSVYEDGQWEPFFPFAIYAQHQRQDFSFYGDLGFNVVMNDQGKGLESRRAVEAGMRFMMLSHGFKDPNSYPSVSDAIANLERTWIEPGGGSVLAYDRLFAFNYDNETFTDCGVKDASGTCIMRTWEAQVAPLSSLYAYDRSKNGGSRGVPSYYLNGHPNVARPYALAPIGGAGDVRMDVTGSYGTHHVDQLERNENQVAPVVLVQIQTSAFNRYRSLFWAGVAAGAHGVGTWRDWIPSSDGLVYKAPHLRVCAPADPGFLTRNTYYDPDPSTTVEGAASGARAEILRGAAPWSYCASGSGFSYHVRMLPNGSSEALFQPGEGLVDVATGLGVPGATVHSVSGDYLVDYELSLEHRAWPAEILPLKAEVAAIDDMLRKDHWTAWSADCELTLTGLPGSPVAQYGDRGFVCGGRMHGGLAFLIVSNTYYDVDPFAGWGQQIVGAEAELEVTLSDLPYTPTFAVEFDPTTMEFDGPSHPIADGTFTATIPGLEARIFAIAKQTGGSGGVCGLVGVEPALALGALAALRRRRSRRADAGRAGEI